MRSWHILLGHHATLATRHWLLSGIGLWTTRTLAGSNGVFRRGVVWSLVDVLALKIKLLLAALI